MKKIIYTLSIVLALALSANSPFFEGGLTGLRSSRTFQFSVFPRTNIPDYFNDFNEYKSIINKYLESNNSYLFRHFAF